MNTPPPTDDHTAAFAQAFFIANLLFVGVFYLALWLLYRLRYKDASIVTRQHLKQTLLASSISTLIFVAINSFILLGSGYASLSALISLEIYFMLIVPVFLLFGVMGFIKALNHQEYRPPLIGRFI